MKYSKLMIATILFSFFVSKLLATEINGRIILFNQNNNHYSVKLQINSDINNAKLGGATFVISYDPNFLNFPSEPVSGVDYTFNNFTGGTYDTATVTKISDNQIWLNISLDSDGNGISLEGPNNWTNVVNIRFEMLEPLVSEVISWNHESLYWKVYDDDNITTLQVGNFSNSVIIHGTEDDTSPTKTYQLSQNYPNPFNPTTTIKYQIPELSNVTLTIYDVLGNEITTLVDEERPIGIYEVDWNVSNVPSGVYFY